MPSLPSRSGVLASDATLTLLNGRRMPSVGMVEASTVSVIPSALIERIDIISDGASATYGADAVAGVVNIVTRKATDGIELRARGGLMTDTGAKSWDASALAATNWGSGSIYGMASYQRRDEFVGDPVVSGTTPLQISQLPQEDLSGFYAGIRQEAGDITLSLDASRFRRDRRARLDFPDTPRSNRDYLKQDDGLDDQWQYALGRGGRNRGRCELRLWRNGLGQPPDLWQRPGHRLQSPQHAVRRRGYGTDRARAAPAGPLTVAGGAQYRVETLETDAAIFFHLAGAKRRAKSVFGEVNVPVVGPDSGGAAHAEPDRVGSSALRGSGFRFRAQRQRSTCAGKSIARWLCAAPVPARSSSAALSATRSASPNKCPSGASPFPVCLPGGKNPPLPDGNALVIYRAGGQPGAQHTAGRYSLRRVPTSRRSFFPASRSAAGYYRIKIKGRVVTPSQDDARDAGGPCSGSTC